MSKADLKAVLGHVDSKESIFVAAPRQLSLKRFTQIVKRYLPKANIILGISKEKYVVGFENQLQFEMLRLDDVQSVIDKVTNSDSPHKVFCFEYSQMELVSILQKNDFKRVLLVNGSWKYAFHNSEAYKALIDRNVGFKFISPFVDENEAKQYEASHNPRFDSSPRGALLTQQEMIALADRAATQSYDNSFQTGVSLGRRVDDEYEFITTAFNEVIPYQTYALHHGNSREKNLSRPHDTNHYDTIHAEMQLLTKVITEKIDISKTTLFVNLLPCPNCARVLSQTDIVELVYRHDHSDGYAVTMFELSGKIARKVAT
jgi:deoxycytidylate deaminase